MTKTRSAAFALATGAAAASVLFPIAHAAAGTGNHNNCPKAVVRQETSDWVTEGAATVALHSGKGVVLTTTASDEDKATWDRSHKMSLAQARGLSYETQTLTGHANPAALPAYYLSVDTDNDGDLDTKLIFEPYYQVVGSPSGETTKWDVATGKFWSNSAVTESHMKGWPLNENRGGSYAGNKTMAEIQAMWPLGQIIGYGINLGTYNPNVVARVNNVRFGCEIHEWLPAPVPTTPTGEPTTTPTNPAPGGPTTTATATGAPTTTPTATPPATKPATPGPTGSGDVIVTQGPTKPVANDDDLPLTGAGVVTFLGAGVLLVAAGAGAWFVARRRNANFTA